MWPGDLGPLHGDFSRQYTGPRGYWPALWSLCQNSLSCWLHPCKKEPEDIGWRKPLIPPPLTPASCSNLGPIVKATGNHKIVCSLLFQHRNCWFLYLLFLLYMGHHKPQNYILWSWLADRQMTHSILPSGLGSHSGYCMPGKQQRIQAVVRTPMRLKAQLHPSATGPFTLPG